MPVYIARTRACTHVQASVPARAQACAHKRSHTQAVAHPSGRARTHTNAHARRTDGRTDGTERNGRKREQCTHACMCGLGEYVRACVRWHGAGERRVGWCGMWARENLERAELGEQVLEDLLALVRLQLIEPRLLLAWHPSRYPQAHYVRPAALHERGLWGGHEETGSETLWAGGPVDSLGPKSFPTTVRFHYRRPYGFSPNRRFCPGGQRVSGLGRMAKGFLAWARWPKGFGSAFRVGQTHRGATASFLLGPI